MRILDKFLNYFYSSCLLFHSIIQNYNILLKQGNFINRFSDNWNMELSVDSETGRLLVSPELIDFLELVLKKPIIHKKELPHAVEVAIKAFIACIARVGGAFTKLTVNGQLEFVVHDERVFDRIIRLCFQTLAKCLYHLLEPLEKNHCKKSKKPERRHQYSTREHFKHWHRYGPLTKRYLEAVNIFLFELQSSDIVVPTIRAIADLVGLFLSFPKLCKNLIKSLVRIWSQQHVEEARCMAFVVLCKITRMNPEFFPIIYKSSYVAYIANCKVVTEETLPSINFMKRAFIELTFLQPSIAYQYAFVYIRQFAIHLRNGMIAKRKDLVQTIYNWQFLNGLQVWTGLICEGTRRFPTDEAEGEWNWFREMAHPLVEIISITERLFLSTKYLPLRIHCLRMLLSIQTECNIFIPTLAYSIELLDELAQMDAKKPQTGKGFTKGIVLDKMLRLSREQHDNKGVRQYLAQQLCALATDALKAYAVERSHRSLLAPISVKVRHFIKTNPNREYVWLFKKLKMLMSAEGGNE